MTRAQARNAAGTFVALETAEGVFAVPADDPRLRGVTVEPYDVVPAPVRTITPLAFMERLTRAERAAIRRAARADDALEDWLDLLRAAQAVDLDDPRTVAGVDAMVAAGLLAPRRREWLLADAA